jgi:hypothetical protein
MKQLVIKSLNTFILEMPIYLSIDTEKNKGLYINLCNLRNQLIENNIIDKSFRHRLCFYTKIHNNYVKIKEGDEIDGIIYLNIDDDIDYSEPVNILYHLEKRITYFEKDFKEIYSNVFNEDNKEIVISYYIMIKKLWNEFKDKNSDCFDYADWYFLVKPNGNIANILNKMALDIKKWICQKEKIMYELDLFYLNTLKYCVNDNDFSIIEKFINDV